MKKLLALIFSIGLLFIFACDDEESDKFKTGAEALEKITDEAMNFINQNGIELPLSVGLDQIDDLEGDEYSSFALKSASGAYLAEPGTGGSGTADSGSVNVGISLSSSLASSRAQISGVVPQALVVNSKGALLVVLKYNSISGLYSAVISLGGGSNYICIILFKDESPWKKTGFMHLGLDDSNLDTTPPQFVNLWQYDNAMFEWYAKGLQPGIIYMFTEYAVEISEPGAIYILSAGMANNQPVAPGATVDDLDAFITAGEGGLFNSEKGIIDMYPDAIAASFMLDDVNSWVTYGSYYYIYVADEAGNVSEQTINFEAMGM